MGYYNSIEKHAGRPAAKGDMDMNYLGVDLGTSSVKLILMDAAGKILRTVSKE